MSVLETCGPGGCRFAKAGVRCPVAETAGQPCRVEGFIWVSSLGATSDPWVGSSFFRGTRFAVMMVSDERATAAVSQRWPSCTLTESITSQMVGCSPILNAGNFLGFAAPFLNHLWLICRQTVDTYLGTGLSRWTVLMAALEFKRALNYIEQ